MNNFTVYCNCLLSRFNRSHYEQFLYKCAEFELRRNELTLWSRNHGNTFRWILCACTNYQNESGNIAQLTTKSHIAEFLRWQHLIKRDVRWMSFKTTRKNKWTEDQSGHWEQLVIPPMRVSSRFTVKRHRGTEEQTTTAILLKKASSNRSALAGSQHPHSRHAFTS